MSKNDTETKNILQITLDKLKYSSQTSKCLKALGWPSFLTTKNLRKT